MRLINLAKAIHFAILILPTIEAWDGWVHSWYRCEERNAHVGGHAKSRHMDGTAVDAGFYRKEDRDAAYDACYEKGLHGLEKEWTDHITGAKVYGFHMQLEEPRS